jgi:RNA polymerase sigma-70 factor (ECF subfamily)
MEDFRILAERHHKAVFRLAYRMTGNQHDAEDVVQECFLRAFKQLSKFDGRSAFGTWLHRIAANCAIDLIRARKKRDQNQGTEWNPDITASHDPSPERLTGSGEIRRMLEPALARLSDMERAAFVMRHYEGLGIEDIGSALGVEPNAAKHTVFRAVQKLRRALQPALGVAQ